MEDWNTEMVYNSLRVRGEQKTKQALRDSGFDEHEVAKILSISLGSLCLFELTIEFTH